MTREAVAIVEGGFPPWVKGFLVSRPQVDGYVYRSPRMRSRHTEGSFPGQRLPSISASPRTLRRTARSNATALMRLRFTM